MQSTAEKLFITLQIQDDNGDQRENGLQKIILRLLHGMPNIGGCNQGGLMATIATNATYNVALLVYHVFVFKCNESEVINGVLQLTKLNVGTTGYFVN